MKTVLKSIASLLLFLNGVGAIYGGLNLIAHPDGSSLHMPLYFLDHSPFQDYFIPGIILLIANGLFSLFVLVALFLNVKKYPLLIIAQGAILTGWIVIQCLMLQVVDNLHLIYGSIGLLLIICGIVISVNIEARNGFRSILRSGPGSRTQTSQS